MTIEILTSTKKGELIDKKTFVTAAMDENSETFMMRVVVLKTESLMLIYLAKKTQIAILQADKTPTQNPVKHLEYTNVFFPNLTLKPSEHIVINYYAINFCIRLLLMEFWLLKVAEAEKPA